MGDQPAGRSVRQARIQALVETHEIASQAELAELLAAQGITASQGTLSRDLVEIGAVRVRGRRGTLVYAPAGSEGEIDQPAAEQKLAKVCSEVLVSADASGNLAVLKTSPGAAQYFASAIDKVGWPQVVGSIAGDDTVLVISRDAEGGSLLAKEFRDLASRGAAGQGRSRQTDGWPKE